MDKWKRMQYNNDPQEEIDVPICECGCSMELREDGDDGRLIRFWQCPECEEVQG
jgi:hypothetical protein